MIAFIIVLYEFIKHMRNVFGHKELRGLFIFAGITILIGAVFYHNVEHWTWLNSFYFVVISLTTIGYGDITPTTPLGRFFTMFYVIMGVGILAMFIGSVADLARRENALRMEKEIPPRSGKAADPQVPDEL